MITIYNTTYFFICAHFVGEYYKRSKLEKKTVSSFAFLPGLYLSSGLRFGIIVTDFNRFDEIRNASERTVKKLYGSDSQ